MAKTFKRGDHVEWNSEAGRVRGVITKKVVCDLPLKGYVHHATYTSVRVSFCSTKAPLLTEIAGRIEGSGKHVERPIRRWMVLRVTGRLPNMMVE
jgi:hypothetical protein